MSKLKTRYPYQNASFLWLRYLVSRIIDNDYWKGVVCECCVHDTKYYNNFIRVSEPFRFYLVLGHGESYTEDDDTDSWSSTYQSPVSGKNHVWKHTTMDYCMLWAAAITTSIKWNGLCELELQSYSWLYVRRSVLVTSLLLCK